MKRLFAVAAFLLASTAAQAQYTFEYNGHTIRVDPDRGTVSIPGVYDNTGRGAKRSRREQDSPQKQLPAQTKVEPQSPAATVAPAVPPAAPANALSEPSTASTNVAPANAGSSNQSSPGPSQVQPDASLDTKPATPPIVATTAAQPIVEPKPPVPPVQAANSPLGVWLTEEKAGKIRIEQCGPNLCGYAVNAKSNQNGEQILINMRPGKDSKWSGRIFDPNTGSTYDSTIALKSADSLRVQGCAFGGMFCGGQTWSRVN